MDPFEEKKKPCPLCDTPSFHYDGKPRYRYNCPTCGKFQFTTPVFQLDMTNQKLTKDQKKKLSNYIQSHQKNEDEFLLIDSAVMAALFNNSI